MCIHLCASMCVCVSAAGFLGQVSQQWFGQNGTKSLCEWHTSQRVSCHVLLLREEPSVTLSCSNWGKRILFWARKHAFCHFSYTYSRYSNINFPLIVCMRLPFSLCMSKCICVAAGVCMNDRPAQVSHRQGQTSRHDPNTSPDSRLTPYLPSYFSSQTTIALSSCSVHTNKVCSQ